MTVPKIAEATLASLSRQGMAQAEVYLKEGRSRRYVTEPAGTEVGLLGERGWAVRAGDRNCSFFATGTGFPNPEEAWPEPDGYPLRLPEPRPLGSWREPSDLDAPLLGEREGLALLEELSRCLTEELPVASLVSARLEDGSSRSWLASSRDLRASWRHRLASLLMVARTEEAEVRLRLSEREARRFHPPTLARALADRLTVRDRGRPGDRDRGEMLLAPAVGCRLLSLSTGYWIGPEAGNRLRNLSDPGGRIGSTAFTLVDDGRLPGGVLSAPVDGEGVPTRETVLVDEGRPRQPLLSWWQAREGRGTASGCSRRASWRDLPEPGPTHLYLRPHRPSPAVEMVRSVTRGYYLLDSPSEGRIDLESGQLTLPVYGFRLDSGRAVEPVSGMVLRGTVSSLLRGIRSVGRDVSFFPLDGMIGCPTLSVTGLELVPS
ncbi:MAG: TldD/PmbA family protein [Thermoanaerobaculia bacterium]|nr:TldD/PmbA family protein [Thermoanaerobaculia bacterium]